MIKVLFLFGTRPEAIKLAPVVLEFKKHAAFEVKVGITAQHRQMLDQVLEFFMIKPDYDLNIMQPDQTLPDLTARIIQSVSANILAQFNPDWMVVQGDTTTAMAGALSAFYAKTKVAHVEAGLRSFNLHSPFPEEMNRVVISGIADYHFCPTEEALRNLHREGISKHVLNVGNTVIDAVELGLKMLAKIDQQLFYNYFSGVDFKKRIILVTCHRRESFGQPFENICKALLILANADPDYQIVYPVHLNPNIRENASRYLGGNPNIVLIDPLPYAHLLWLMNRSSIILTDSGGIQEEAPTLNKPVLVLRDVTERMEGINSGTAILVGTDTEKITAHALTLLRDEEKYNAMAHKPNPYGDGQSSKRIAETLMQYT
jgi:UDP-N-acetylglucosamine 2-epimerase (non-hydrolysing)